MLRAEERDIGGLKYKITQLGAVKGRAVALRLVKAIGPAFASLAGKGKLEEALPGLFANLSLDENDLTYFCDAFAEKTFVFTADGKMPRLDNVFDVHFAGKYRDMMGWLIACVEVNYSDFFRGLPVEGKSVVSPPDVPTPTAPS